jgi:hypothetical protein
MREIRQSGSVRGVRRNPYPYRDFVICQNSVSLEPPQWVEMAHDNRDNERPERTGPTHINVHSLLYARRRK